jgi:hypothetical protein
MAWIEAGEREYCMKKYLAAFVAIVLSVLGVASSVATEHPKSPVARSQEQLDALFKTFGVEVLAKDCGEGAVCRNGG